MGESLTHDHREINIPAEGFEAEFVLELGRQSDADRRPIERFRPAHEATSFSKKLASDNGMGLAQ